MHDIVNISCSSINDASFVWTVEIMLVAEIQWTILIEMMWLNMVVEKSKLISFSGDELYKSYRYPRNYVLKYAMHTWNILEDCGNHRN